MEENKVEAYLSPRQQICPPTISMEFTDSEGEKLAQDGTMCLKMIDTKQEKKIDAGVSWPFEKLEKGECIIASDFKEQGVSVGDKVYINMYWINFWNNVAINGYNPYAEENGLPLWVNIAWM